MSKLFKKEQSLLEELLDYWYEAMKLFTKYADGIFSTKGKQYDRESPVWERVRFPRGYVQELRKKTDRVNQLLADYQDGSMENVDWSQESGVLEELIDIMNYSRMFGGLIIMKLADEEEDTNG